jgi:hypothetical protein
LSRQKAATVAAVEWVYRCKQLCDASGLTANGLLAAVNLNPDSPFADWQAMGEAAMAASR